MATATHGYPTHPQAAARPLQAVAAVQGVFYVATGVWPLVHVDSFLAVTGPKTDLWLVYTVGVLVTVVGAVLLLAARSGRVTPEIVALAVGAAVVLAGIDVVFVLRNVIPPIYLADAAVEAVLVLWWGVASARRPPN